MRVSNRFLIGVTIVVSVSCAHTKSNSVQESDALRLERKLVKEAVIFEPGTKEGAVVPDISAPRLRAILVPEHVENGRLIEKHREWILEGDITILGTTSQPGGKSR